jgi:hypothetical protein
MVPPPDLAPIELSAIVFERKRAPQGPETFKHVPNAQRGVPNALRCDRGGLARRDERHLGCSSARQSPRRTQPSTSAVCHNARLLYGTLIAESLRLDAPLELIDLRVDKIVRRAVGDDPPIWTFIEFEADEAHAEPLARTLSEALDADHGWYCDFRTPAETFVVFARRVFRYPRGDASRRGEAENYGRSVGVPDSQLDWPE